LFTNHQHLVLTHLLLFLLLPLNRMSFSSSRTITLPYSLHRTIPKLGIVGSGSESVARLSPVLTAYEIRNLDMVWINDEDLLAGMDRRELADLEVVEEGEEEGGEGREGHRKVERIAFYIKNTIQVPMFTHIVELTGHGFYDEKVSLLTTRVRSRRRAEEAPRCPLEEWAEVELELTLSSPFHFLFLLFSFSLPSCFFPLLRLKPPSILRNRSPLLKSELGGFENSKQRQTLQPSSKRKSTGPAHGLCNGSFSGKPSSHRSTTWRDTLPSSRGRFEREEQSRRERCRRRRGSARTTFGKAFAFLSF